MDEMRGVFLGNCVFKYNTDATSVRLWSKGESCCPIILGHDTRLYNRCASRLVLVQVQVVMIHYLGQCLEDFGI